jgi:Kef-type K+ transport system membrane component KefB
LHVGDDPYAVALLGVAVVIVVARAVGALFRRIGQPPVIGEIIVGVALGPSVAGGWSERLFPLDGRPLLRMLATAGLVVFMFRAGVEAPFSEMRGRSRLVSRVVLGATVVPFALGLLLGLALHPSNRQVSTVAFCLFVGTAVAVSALPVLARILADRELVGTPLGAVALAAAAGTDVIIWMVLSVVVAVVASRSAWDSALVVALWLGFVALLVLAARYVLPRFRDHPADALAVSAVVAGVFACSFLTSAIGVHLIFGAFALGAAFPRGRLADEVGDRLEPFVAVLLPVFFVITGLDVDVGQLGLASVWQLVLVLVLACSGKVVGVLAATAGRGLAVRDSLGLGILLNTRGLTELVVLGIGRELGVLTQPTFTLFVLMAIITTMATGPLLRVVGPDPQLAGGRPGPAGGADGPLPDGDHARRRVIRRSRRPGDRNGG